MSSGKWQSFCLGLNVLHKAATTSLLQCLMVFRVAPKLARFRRHDILLRKQNKQIVVVMRIEMSK